MKYSHRESLLLCAVLLTFLLCVPVFAQDPAHKGQKEVVILCSYDQNLPLYRTWVPHFEKALKAQANSHLVLHLESSLAMNPRSPEKRKEGKLMEKLRKDLSAPGLLSLVRGCFDRIIDHRNARSTISLGDALMSGLAVFSLKCASLLWFDQHRQDPTIAHNLHTLYGVKQTPCDSKCVRL